MLLLFRILLILYNFSIHNKEIYFEQKLYIRPDALVAESFEKENNRNDVTVLIQTNLIYTTAKSHVILTINLYTTYNSLCI